MIIKQATDDEDSVFHLSAPSLPLGATQEPELGYQKIRLEKSQNIVVFTTGLTTYTGSDKSGLEKLFIRANPENLQVFCEQLLNDCLERPAVKGCNEDISIAIVSHRGEI